MNYTQSVAPTSEPLSVEDAKAFMRILESDDDAQIEAMIKSAREYAENYTNRQFVEAAFEWTNSVFIQDLKLPKNPIQSIVKIEYMDTDGVYQILSTDSYYIYGEDGISKVHFSDLPNIKDDKRAVKITFISGYATVPESIVSYLKVLVSNIYENREFYVIGVSVDKNANPLMNKMLEMYRVQPI